MRPGVGVGTARHQHHHRGGEARREQLERAARNRRVGHASHGAMLTNRMENTGLPIDAHRDELLAAIRDHQVVIVAGETGSGKSTQLPKLCLELGRGAEGVLIGHTQPRRVAARTIAERVAEELGTELGTTVGYTVRFTDRVGDQTRIKVMTDGILLAEIQRDRMLRRYDTLIIDEAHERSLNIDFLLGYLRQLLPKRPDLKVIVTSATIDTARFSHHFHAAPMRSVCWARI
ncbi:MAG: DEAD/DEAH box helicase, partial [Actinobacteria bacterium]|nr:DEAD/DEAH box helicase [Actinomycetota bacterium]